VNQDELERFALVGLRATSTYFLDREDDELVVPMDPDEGFAAGVTLVPHGVDVYLTEDGLWHTCEAVVSASRGYLDPPDVDLVESGPYASARDAIVAVVTRNVTESMDDAWAWTMIDDTLD